MVTEAIDWYFNAITHTFTLVVSSWALSSIFFVSILYLIARFVVQVRNK